MILFNDLITKINTTKDLKPIRQSSWFRDLCDLVNWFEVGGQLTGHVQVTVIGDLMDNLATTTIGGRALRLDVWRRLLFLSKGNLSQ